MRTQQIVNRHGEELQSTALRQIVSHMMTQDTKRQLGERVAQKYNHSADIRRPSTPHNLERDPFLDAGQCVAKNHANVSRDVFALPKSTTSVSGDFEARDNAAGRVKRNLRQPADGTARLPPVRKMSDEFHEDQQFAAEIVRRKYKFEADVAAVLDYGVPKGLEETLPRVVHEGSDYEDAMKAAQRRREERLDLERQELLKRSKRKVNKKEMEADTHQIGRRTDHLLHLDLPKCNFSPENPDDTRVPAPPTAPKPAYDTRVPAPPTAPKPADDTGSRDLRTRKVKEAFEAAKKEIEEKNSRKVRKGCDGLSYNIDVSSFKPATSNKRLDRAHEKVLAWNANTAKRGVGFKSKKRKMEEAKKFD